MSKLQGNNTIKHADEAFTVQKGILRVNKDMYWEGLDNFDAACRKLLDSRQSRIVLDLTAVNFISSSFLGCLINTVFQATRLKKKVRFIVTYDVSWLFEIMGVERNLEMEIH